MYYIHLLINTLGMLLTITSIILTAVSIHQYLRASNYRRSLINQSMMIMSNLKLLSGSAQGMNFAAPSDKPELILQRVEGSINNMIEEAAMLYATTYGLTIYDIKKLSEKKTDTIGYDFNN
jgi:hypothetical protein